MGAQLILRSTNGGRKDGSKISSSLGFVLNGWTRADLVQSLLQTGEHDGAQAVSLHLRGDDIISDRHAQAFELELPSGRIISFQDTLHSLGRIPDLSP